MEPIRRVLDAMRARGYHVIHTREGHRPDLSDHQVDAVGCGDHTTSITLDQPEILTGVRIFDGDPAGHGPCGGGSRHGPDRRQHTHHRMNPL